MYLSGLMTATDASSPDSIPLSKLRLRSFLFDVMGSTVHVEGGLKRGRGMSFVIVIAIFLFILPIPPL